MEFSIIFGNVAKLMFVLLPLACKGRSLITPSPLTETVEDYGKLELIESFMGVQFNSSL